MVLGRFWEHVHMFLLELAHIHTRDLGVALPLVFFFPQPHLSVCFVQLLPAFVDFS